MSSEKNPSPKTLIERVIEVQQEALALRHRRLLVLSGERVWCQTEAHALIETLNVADTLWVGQGGPDGIDTLVNRQALERLGGETGLLIYDTFSGFDPDAFGALSGTLRGGGLLLLLAPPLDSWHDFDDPEHERITVAGYASSSIRGNFLRRLSAILQSDNSVIIATTDQPVASDHRSHQPTLASTSNSSGVCRTADQQQAVEAILHVVKGHRRRPLVLSSDRGRGKSSALGIAAAQLMLEEGREILVTAPRKSVTDSLFQQASRLLPDATSDANSLNLNGSVLRYSAPDHLLANPQTADLLLVDEAAAIPTPLLESLLKRYARLVFATTVHGYEGTGRGFSIRFKSHLDRETPNWRELQLKAPIRWAANDPLEALIFRLLALDASAASDDQLSNTSELSVTVEMPNSEHLLESEADLGQIFGLLILAHYRTTPLDLRLLLDGPNLKTLVLRHGQAIAGVALLASEGGFDSALSDQIWAGYRRPRGHLLAQSLAAHVGVKSAPLLKCLRIMRIAIHPAIQRRRLGSRLVTEIHRYALDNGFDYIGTSFGASEMLIDFWHHNGLDPVRLGLRTGASSGGHSVMLIKALTPVGKTMADEAKMRFAQHLPGLLGDTLRDLPSQLAKKLLIASDNRQQICLTPQDWFDLAGYAYARRGYETSLPAIEKLSLIGLGNGEVSTTDADLLIMRVVQKQGWQACARACGLSGKRETEERLRKILAMLIEIHDTEKNYLSVTNIAANPVE